MKLATIVTLGILLLGACASLNAQPAATSQVVLAYMNEKVPPSATLPGFDGLCLIYYTLVGDLDLNSLFAGSLFGGLMGQPTVDRAHAYFIWASDYSAQYLTQNDAFTSFLITEGTATIYYSSTPEQRRFDLPTDRSSWGQPVATFVRKAGMFQSTDGGTTGTFASTALLVSSKPFQLNGKTFDFKNLVPYGMTCFETGVGDYEAGTCIAIGGK